MAAKPGDASNMNLTVNYWFDGRRDLIESTQAVISYVRYLHTTFDYDWSLALTAYHAGITPVLKAVQANKAKGVPTTLEYLDLPEDVKSFVPQLVAIASAISPNQSGIHLPEIPNESFNVVGIPGQIEFDRIASSAKIDPESIRLLNAGNKRSLTDPDGPHRLLVSHDDFQALSKFIETANMISQVSKSAWNRHIVRPKENLSLIAKHFDTTVNDLKQVNHLTNNQIHPGQTLLIPAQTPPQSPTNQFQSDLPGPKKTTHVVKPNETLYSIAQQYSAKMTHVVYWNALENKTLKPGQKLTLWHAEKVESPYVYSVKPNDSLDKIARKHHTTIKGLKQVNGLHSDLIHPGDKLIIPAN